MFDYVFFDVKVSGQTSASAVLQGYSICDSQRDVHTRNSVPVLILVLCFWPRQNQCIVGARIARAGFHKFPYILMHVSMHGGRAAHARGFDSLPSLPDVGTLMYTAVAFYV